MPFICNHAMDYKPCKGCKWSEPWEASFLVEQGRGTRLTPAPFQIYRMIQPTRFFKVRHSPVANCPHARALSVPIRVLEVNP